LSIPLQPQAAGKVNERFLFVHLSQHPGRCLQRGELPVGVEDVELAVILPEGRAGIGAAGIVGGVRGTLSFAHNHRLQNAEQPVAVGGEVLEDVHRPALVAQDGDQIHSRHLRADELLAAFSARISSDGGNAVMSK
jgi:hypothetical protein